MNVKDNVGTGIVAQQVELPLMTTAIHMGVPTHVSAAPLQSHLPVSASGKAAEGSIMHPEASGGQHRQCVLTSKIKQTEDPWRYNLKVVRNLTLGEKLDGCLPPNAWNSSLSYNILLLFHSFSQYGEVFNPQDWVKSL